MIPKLKLTYFDFDGGRGEAVRLALTLGKVAFEDDRVSRERWTEIKAQQPFGALPVLYVDGAPLAQTNTICRFVGKLTDLYPSDPWQAAMCDQAMDAAEDLTVQIGATISLGDEEKKAKREALVAETIPTFLTGLEKILLAGGGSYIANKQLTVADFRVSDVVGWLKSGILDHIPADLPDRVAPMLVKHMEMMKSEPRVKAYYESRKK